jgi:hypothetical protein
MGFQNGHEGGNQLVLLDLMFLLELYEFFNRYVGGTSFFSFFRTILYLSIIRTGFPYHYRDNRKNLKLTVSRKYSLLVLKDIEMFQTSEPFCCGWEKVLLEENCAVPSMLP